MAERGGGYSSLMTFWTWEPAPLWDWLSIA
jgi:hypothetical protein